MGNICCPSHKNTGAVHADGGVSGKHNEIDKLALQAIESGIG